MNIFILDNDIEKSVQYHIDRHIVKMPLEAAQMLSTVIAVDSFIGYVPRALTREETQHIRKEAEGWPLYKPTHVNHPCNIWARTSLENYEYLFQYLLELGWEKQHRYPDKPMHKSVQLMIDQDFEVTHLPSKGLTPFAMAMPVDYKEQAIDAIDAYNQKLVKKINSMCNFGYFFFVSRNNNRHWE